MIEPLNLQLDLYAIDVHAQIFMKQLGITYERASPQSLGECWWFYGCRNVPDPLPDALTVHDMLQ